MHSSASSPSQALIDNLKPSLRPLFGDANRCKEERLLAKWISILEPQRLSKYGYYDEPPKRESPWWPQDVPYTQPKNLTATRQYRNSRSLQLLTPT
jgi:hypothetical protein